MEKFDIFTMLLDEYMQEHGSKCIPVDVLVSIAKKASKQHKVENRIDEEIIFTLEEVF